MIIWSQEDLNNVKKFKQQHFLKLASAILYIYIYITYIYILYINYIYIYILIIYILYINYIYIYIIYIYIYIYIHPNDSPYEKLRKRFLFHL